MSVTLHTMAPCMCCVHIHPLLCMASYSSSSTWRHAVWLPCIDADMQSGGHAAPLKTASSTRAAVHRFFNLASRTAATKQPLLKWRHPLGLPCSASSTWRLELRLPRSPLTAWAAIHRFLNLTPRTTAAMQLFLQHGDMWYSHYALLLQYARLQ
jgi:hypothetical protein